MFLFVMIIWLSNSWLLLCGINNVSLLLVFFSTFSLDNLWCSHMILGHTIIGNQYIEPLMVLEISLKDCHQIVRIIITHLLIMNHNGTYCSFITYLVHKLIIYQIEYKFVMVKSIRNHVYHNSNWRVKITILTIKLQWMRNNTNVKPHK